MWEVEVDVLSAAWLKMKQEKIEKKKLIIN